MVLKPESEGTPPPISTVLSQKPVIGTPIKCNSGSFANARECVEDKRWIEEEGGGWLLR
ncbi:hypothetical protein E4U10_007593 [Claviceps purpurea]|nr:hypothetical protein E4U10_007593 [Claviceps purpurea]